MAKSSYTKLADNLASNNWTTTTERADWINDQGSMSATAEQMRTAALIDIMKSLRAIKAVVQCGNAQRAAMSMQALERLAREFWVVPRKRRKKAAAKRTP